MPEYLTISEFARRMNINRKRVQKLIQSGKLTLNKNRRLDYEPSKLIVEQGRQQDKNIFNSAVNENDPIIKSNRKLAEIKVKMAEMEYRQRQGELIGVDEVIQKGEAVMNIVKAKLLNLASKIAPQIANTSARNCKKIIDREIHDALEELSKLKKIT